ncbi:MAG: bifunctional glutamate N-acetyltransferase/amino-acid acetyltransferase ArgJ [Acidimicrobiia bacterium]
MSVVVPAGFQAAGLAAGIKASGEFDMAMIAADRPVAAAGIFTTSRTAAPPVAVSRSHLADGAARAVVVNSGAANAGTGEAGRSDAFDMATVTAQALGCRPTDVLVCSTGPIGGRLPMDVIRPGIAQLASDLGTTERHGLAAARGIMTTDSVPKLASGEGDGWSIGGIAKGAGMVRPDMATMLAFLTTDAAVDAATLDRSLRLAADVSFNSLNIDGCQSTNDTVLLLASGDSGVSAEPEEFASILEEVCRSLALQMAADAEGASKVVTLEVTGAPDSRSARRLGMTVADSALVRSSFYGADPNWGRVLAALGVAGVDIEPTDIDIAYAGVTVCSAGVAVGFDEDVLVAHLKGDFAMEIRVGHGPGQARVVTTDLTPDYVVFNGERS